MSTEDNALLRVAQAVTDRTPVDWELEAESNESLKPRLRRLRLIEEIASAHGADEDITAPRPDSPQATAPEAVSQCLARWGPLQITEKIGEGGFSEVFRAWDATLQREVALKLLYPPQDGDDVDDEHFLNEARKLAQVRHQNVLVVYGADRHEGRVGLWTDLVQGKTLEDRLKAHGPLGAEEAGLVGIDLCRALAAVHGAGLVHRDIKTANVMREEGGRIVLMDFSAATEQGPRRRRQDPSRR